MEDLTQLIPKLSQIGLELNSRKCEFAQLSANMNTQRQSRLASLLPGMKTRTKEDLTLLNSPVHPEATKLALTKSTTVIQRMCDRIKKLDSHTGLFFLTNYTSAPRLNYLLRTAPLYIEPDLTQNIDTILQQTATRVTNVAIDDKSWSQASLPVRHGGL